MYKKVAGGTLKIQKSRTVHAYLKMNEGMNSHIWREKTAHTPTTVVRAAKRIPALPSIYKSVPQNLAQLPADIITWLDVYEFVWRMGVCVDVSR
jgi:hypothetical protein